MATDTNETKELHGSCLCKGVSYTLSGAVREISHCYCSQCRRTHGLMGSYTRSNWDDVHFTNKKTLQWFRSSDSAERGFCNTCGSSLFWHRLDSGYVAISAGTLDQPTGLKVAGHIYTDDLPDYYSLPDDGMPRYGTTSDGKLDGDLST
ncbi:MAG: GFA family protein [Rhodospirillales bacterium]|jgi:hypothetical protein|nr:GFA family protein [Rhodospirillales bacterium]